MKKPFLISTLVLFCSIAVLAQKTRVACLGNSITFGYTIENRELNSYPAQLQRMLGESFDVQNFGVCGVTAQNEGDSPWTKTEEYQKAKAFLPQIAVMKFGTNDSKPQNWLDSERFSKGVESLAIEFENLPSKPKIIICLPAKAYSDGWKINDDIIRNGQLETLRTLARKHHWTLVDLYNKTSGKKELFPDGIHPNADGARIIAEAVKDAVVMESSVPLVTNINKNSYPRLMADNSIVFKLRAPEAKKVQIDLCGKKYDMERGNDGTWTVRTEPQVPGFHYYSVIVDGYSFADPASESYYGCGKMMSAVDIPEKDIEYLEIQDVPHGKISFLRYYSDVTNSWRELCVYTPPSYDKKTKAQYPVLYIQHGGGEDHRGWVQQGRTDIILDNLIAKGKAEEMIVVSANSNVTSSMGGYNWEGMQPYNKELTEKIIPFIDKRFRTKADRKHRAMCGLSMGGGQSFYIGLRNPEIFSAVGVFSTGMFGGITGATNVDIEKEVPGIISRSDVFNKQFDTFLITCGEQDPRIEHNKKVVSLLRSNGTKIEFDSYPGDHEWQVWRKSLRRFAQMIFK